MGIDLYWDDEAQTVMLAEFNGAWTWDELYATMTTIKRLSDERGRMFGAIVDVRSGLNVPGGSIFNRDALSQFQKMLRLGSDGKGPVVILGMNDMVRTVFEAVRRFDGNLTQDVHFARTMDEARRIIYPLAQRLSGDGAGSA